MVSLRLLLAPLLVALHPLHTTLTEMVEQPGGTRVTIVVRAFSDDLKAAVHTGSTSKVEPEDSLLSRYVRAHLIIRTAAGVPVSIDWIGRRITGDLTWITLEADIPGGLAGTHLRNAIHNELFSDQVNIVQARFTGRSTSLLFTGGDGEKTVR